MIKKIPFKVRPCANCKEIKSASEYAITSSIFFPDSHLPICNACLDEFVVELKGEWALMDSICRWADIAFIPDKWTSIWTTTPNTAASSYLRIFQRAEYDKIHWETYQDKWKKAISEGQEKEIHPLFDLKEYERLKKEWGANYSQEELYKLDEMYQGIKKSFGISNSLNEQDGRQLCKLSLEIDRCIADGAAGVDKLVGSYNKLKDGAGFTNDKASDANNFNSISELAYYFEKNGWKEKFHNDETKDIVDATIKNIQNYNSRLYKNEASIGDQIESRLQNMKRVQSLEEMSFMDEDLDRFEADGYLREEETDKFEEEI